MKKRILAIALTLAMLLSLLPAQVFATGPVINGGIHTEHNFVEVQPQQSTQTPEAEDPSAEKPPLKGAQTEASPILDLLDYDAAVADLTYLSQVIGSRLAGSKPESLAQDYVAAEFQKLGYEVTRQDVPIAKNSWFSGTVGEVYVGDLTLAANTPTNNEYYTGFGQASGTAVYLEDPADVASLGSDLSGKIVFFPGNWRTGKDPDTISAIQALDAANAEAIVALLDLSIDAAEAEQKYLPSLNCTSSMQISTPVLLCNAMEAERVPAYLAEHPGIEATVDSRNANTYSQNVIGLKKAAVETDWTIYVSAHIDSVIPSPGANDNGSGVVGVLAMARAFKDIETNYNIAFLTVGAEEIGLVGSAYYADNLTDEEIKHAIGNYNIDMIATSYSGCDYIYMMAPTTAFSLTDNSVENRVVLSTYRAAEQLGYDMNYVTAVKDWASDHSSFNDVGIPAVGYIWSTSGTSLVTEDYYHTINDSMVNGINFSVDRLKTMVDLVATVVYNDATADYVAVVGDGVNREYYTTIEEAQAAAGEGGKVSLFNPHAHCVYGENCEYVKEGKKCEHDTTEFATPLTNADFTSTVNQAGSYYLTEDVTLTGALTLNCGGAIYLCLNGHTIYGSQNLNMYGATKLYLCNCTRETAEDAYFYIDRGEIGDRSAAAELHLHGGTISLKNEYGMPFLEHSVLVVDGGSFIADPGTVADGEGVVYGSGVSGDMNLIFKSGYIENKGEGSAILSYGFGNITLDGDIELVNGQGAGDIMLYLYSAGIGYPRITIGENFAPSEGKSYTVQLSNASVGSGEKYRITEGWDAHYHKFDSIPFESSQNYSIIEYYENDAVELYLVNKGDEELFEQHYHVQEDGRRIYYLNQLDQATWNTFGGYMPAGNYVLVEDITGEPGDASIYGYNGPVAGSTTNICLHGFSMTEDERLNVNESCTISISDCAETLDECGTFSIGQIWSIVSSNLSFENVNVVFSTYTNYTFATIGKVEMKNCRIENNAKAIGMATYEDWDVRIIDCTINCPNTYCMDVDATDSFVIGGSLVVNSGTNPDFKIYDGCYLAFDEENPLAPPPGETYAVLTGTLPGIETPIRFTEGWSKCNLDAIPFVGKQGYAVREIVDANGVKELYLAVPQLTTKVVGNGTLTATDESGNAFTHGMEGTKVILEVVPAAEHILKEYVLTYWDGTQTVTQTLTPDAQGKCEVTMPAADVTVTATIELPHKHTMSVDSHVSENDTENVDFTEKLTQATVPASGNLELGEGAYVLKSDLVLSENQYIVITGDVDLCLNGNTLKVNQIQVWPGGELSICDCSGNHSGTIEGVGDGAAVSNSDKLHVFGGTIKDNSYAIWNYAGGTANIYGGRISADGQYSAGIYNEGTLNASGANISGADCGIDNRSSAIATVTGGNIDGGIYGIRNQGSLEVKDCYIGQGRTAVTYSDGEAVFMPFLPGTPAAELAQWGVAYCTVDMNTATGTLFGMITHADPHVYMIADARSMDFNYLIREGDILETRLKTALDQEGWINVESFFIVDNMFDSDGPRNDYTRGWGRNGAVSHNTDAYQTVVYTGVKQGDSDDWGGSLVGNTLHKIRLDPVVAGTASTLSGSYEYDYVYFGPADKAPSAQMAAADKADYGIHNAGGTVTVSGSADIYGASHGIFTTSGTVNVTGGTISSGREDVGAYGVTVEGGTVNISGGRIETLTHRGVSITGGTVNVSDGAYIGGKTCIGITGGILNITGGTLQSSGENVTVGTGAGVYYAGGEVHLSGAPEINGTSVDFKMSGTDKRIYVDGLLTTTDIYSIYFIDAAPTEQNPLQITVGFEEANNTEANNRFESSEGYLSRVKIAASGKREVFLVAPHTHYMAVDTNNGGLQPDGVTDVTEKTVFNIELDQAKLEELNYTLPAGNYVLTGPIELTKSITVKSNVNLCLSSHTITFAGAAYNLQVTGGTLNICSCGGGGVENTATSSNAIKVSGGQANIYGGSFKADSTGAAALSMIESGSVNIYGGSFITYNGNRSVFMNGTGSMCIYGGTFTHGTGAQQAIYVNGSTCLTVAGGNINGRIEINTSADNVISGGTITHASGNAVSVTGNGKLTVTGGTIEGNGVNNNGIYNSGILTVTGGTITATKYAISHEGGGFNLSGAPVINGGAADIYLGSGKTITVDGTLQPGGDGKISLETAEVPNENNGYKVRITGNWPNSGNTGTIPFIDSRATYSVNKLNSTTKPAVMSDLNELYLHTPVFKVTVQQTVGGTTTTDVSEQFWGQYVAVTAMPDTGNTVGVVKITYLKDGVETDVVYIGSGKDYGFNMPYGDVTVKVDYYHTHYMGVDTANQTQPDGSTATEVVFKNTLDSSFTGGTLTTGDYVLTEPITATSNITISGTVNLCLKGQTLDLGSNQLIVSGTLNLCDCQGDGKLTSANTTAAVLLNQKSAKLYMYGGTIQATKGHGVSLGTTSISNVNLSLYGGTIDAAKSGAYITQGTVSAYSDAVTIKAGEYAIYSMETYFRRGIYLYASPKLEGKTADFYLDNNVTINVMEKLEENALYSVALNAAPAKGTKRQLTNYWGDAGNQANNGVFYSVNGYKIFLENNELWIERHIHTLADGTEIEYDIPLTEEFISTLDTQHRVPVGNYVLVGDVETSDLHFKGNGQSHLCLCGYTLTTNSDNADASFYSDEGASLRIDDCQETGVINSSCVYLGGNITLHKGNIIANKSVYGNGVVVHRSNGVFVMEGGSVTVNDIEHASGGYISKDYAAQHFTSGVINAENWGVNVNMDTYLSGDLVIQSTNGDFAIRSKSGYTIIIEGTLNPGDEVYTVDTDVVPAEYTGPIQITTDWEKSGLTSTDTSPAKIPFESVQGYAVVEMIDESTGKKELYLVMPEVNCESQPAQGGTVVANPSAALVGTENIEVTVTTNPGYAFESVSASYVDRLGQTHEVALTATENGTYTLTMPEGNVTVTANFSLVHSHYMAVDTENGLPNGDEPNGAEWIDFSIGLTQSNYTQYLDAVMDENGSLAYYTLKIGSYVLQSDITLDVPVVIEPLARVNLCLNGKTLTFKGQNHFEVIENAVLNVCNCEGDGTIVSEEGAAIMNNGGFNLYGGTLRSNATDVATIINFGGHTTVYGGRVESPGFIAIQSNDREAPFTEDIYKGNVTIHGGYVIGKNAGIQCDANCTGTVTVTGGTVTSYDLTDDTESDSNTYGIQNLGTGLVSVSGGVVSSGSISGQKNNTYGICSGSTGNVEISGSAQVSCGNVNGKASNGYAVYNAEGELTVSGGTITTGTVSGGDAANNNDATLSEQDKLADDASVYGIYNREGTANIKGMYSNSLVSITGGAHGEENNIANHSYGVYSGNRLNVDGSYTDISAPDYGISNVGTLFIENGKISATAAFGRAIYNTGRAEIIAATITATANEATGITNNGTVVVGQEISEDVTEPSPYPLNVRGNRAGVYNEGEGQAVINGGTITGTYSGAGNTGSGRLVVQGGSVTGGQNGIYNEASGEVEVVGGIITGTDLNGIGNTGSGKVEVYGGTIYGGTSGIYTDSIRGNRTGNELNEEEYAVLVGHMDGFGPAVIGKSGEKKSYSGINTVNGLVIVNEADARIEAAGPGIYVNPNGSVIVENGNVVGGVNGVENHGLTYVRGGTVTGTGNTGIQNLDDGQLYVSGSGTVTGNFYGISNTAQGDIWITGGSVIGNADSGLFLTGPEAKCYVSGGWIQGSGYHGIYLAESFLELTGGAVYGNRYGVYMLNVGEGETDKIGTFRLSGAPTIKHMMESTEAERLSDLYFDTHCRVTVIGQIPDKVPNSEEDLSWSVLTAERPTYDQPIPFTIDWQVVGDGTDNMMKDEEGETAERKSFMTHFFTSELYDVQLHTADAPTDDDLEVVLAISTEYSDTVVDVYLWAGENKGVYVSKEQLIAAVDRNPSPTLMFNREHTTLTADMVSGWYAGDRTGFSGEAYPYPSDSTNPEKLWIRTPNVGTQEFTATIGYSLLDNATGSMGYRETTFRIRVRAFDVKDSVFVLDYGLKADLNRGGALFAEDVIGMDQTTETHLLEALSQTEPQYAVDYTNWTQSISFEEGQLPMIGSFGSFSFKEAESSTEETPVYLSSLAEGASLVYTPTRFMEGTDQIYLAMRVHDSDVEPTAEIGTFDPTKEVEMFKKVTVLPANVVYYEDFFTDLEWYDDEQTNAIMTIDDIGQNYAQYQDVDQDQEYGHDSGYETLDTTYTGSGGNYKKITVKGKGEILKFDFMGTGFDLVGSTTADSGSLIYAVYSIDPNEENPVTDNSNLVQRSTLNTVYNVPNGAIYEVPLLHVSDLAYGKYRVIITSVAKYDWSSDDRDPETNLPPVKTAYLYLDGIRIYNPLSMMDEGREYYNMGEKSAQFLHLRSMLLKGQAAAAKITSDGKFTFGSGLVSYAEQSKEGMWYEGNNVSSLNDYLTAGPNNEVYFNENTQSLVLYAREIEAGEGDALNPKTMLQIAIRNLNPAAFDDHDPVPEGGNKDGNAPAFALLGSGGSTLQLLCDGSDEAKAISYSEQYYTVNFENCVKETINGKTYYRIVISAGNGSAFALTNLKVSNLEFYTIPASASSYKYNNNGELIETNNPNATEMPNLQELAWQLQAANGMLPEDPMNPDGSTELVFRSISLSLQSSIGMNFYVEDETLEGYTDPYVVVTKECYDEVGNLLEEKRVTVTLDQFEKMTAAGDPCHVFRFTNIAAKEMNSTITATLYATKGEELVQGETRIYSVVQYAENMLTKTEDPSLKTLLVDMLNYGAAAQVHFNYNNGEGTLANASQKIRDAQSYATLEAPIVNSYLNSSSSDDQDIRMEVAITNVSLSLVDRVEANFYMSNRGADLNEVALVVAYEDITGNVVQQRIEGKDFVETQTTNTTNPATYYKAVCDKLNATEMRTILNVWVVDKDGMRISNAVTYSIESYAASMKDKENATDQLKSLLEAMMKYGDSTAAYFAEPSLEATMIQGWYCQYWSQQEWIEEFKLMKELGIKSLIIQNLVYGGNGIKNADGTFTPVLSIYPTDVEFSVISDLDPDGYMKPAWYNNDTDQLAQMLEAAKMYDMTVYIGLIEDDHRWGKFGFEENYDAESFKAWSDANSLAQQQMIEEIWQKYGSVYGQQIAGWYYTNEIYNVTDTLEATNRASYETTLADNLNGVINAINANGGKPLMLSPYFNPKLTEDESSAENYANWWSEMFTKINFRKGDIFVPQDTVGADGDVDTRIHIWIAALAKAARKANGMQFWVNNESFRTSGSNFVSAPVEDFLKQYEASNLYSKKHIIFSWNHYYSPNNNAEYQAYHDALKAYFS